MTEAYEKVKLARHKDRPTAISYIKNIIGDFVELHGDRRFADDKAIIAGVGRLGKMPVTVVAIEKGVDLNRRVMRNFGCANPEGYRKAIRHFEMAQKFKRPVICFVDTPGAFCGIGAEERGQGQAIAESITKMISLKVPTVSIIIGEGGSGGALALAAADEVWMLENSIYSVISPEGCASILWRDTKNAEKVKEAAKNLKLTAGDLYKLGVIEKVFSEDQPFEKLCAQIEKELVKTFKKNLKLTEKELLDNRYQKYRKIGREN
jgi:acetyl-CoA carboxylase carboxyl transferase subunit alpha